MPSAASVAQGSPAEFETDGVPWLRVRPLMVGRGCDVLPDEERIGRAAGVACAAARASDVVDAIVVATAITRAAAVVTCDPGDLKRLADALGVKLRLHVI